jgi:flagellar biosynthesis/type III secretory pathway ATPase
MNLMPDLVATSCLAISWTYTKDRSANEPPRYGRPVGTELLGRVVDRWHAPVDDRAMDLTAQTAPDQAEAPSISSVSRSIPLF